MSAFAFELIEGRGLQEQKKISVVDVNKIYQAKTSRTETVALKHINISIDINEFVTIVGPSGCGKSTLLRMIAGLDTPTSGKIIINGSEVTGPGADRGMVFQTYTLFPWLTVEQNIKFGLKLKKTPEQKTREIVDRYLELIGLTNFRHSYPKELSGGMKQRVAIARALANSPEVLLMDEPFGALDPQTKSAMQELLLKIWRTEKTTVIFITHDIEEAIFLSQRVYVMSACPGELEEEIQINLPRNRTQEIKDSDAFIEIKRKIAKTLKHGNQNNS